MLIKVSLFLLFLCSDLIKFLIVSLLICNCRTSLAFRLMPQLNAILDCTPIASAGHVIPQNYVPISFSQFMDDLSAEEDALCQGSDKAHVCCSTPNKLFFGKKNFRITRKIDPDISTNIPSSRRSITTQGYRNTSRVDLFIFEMKSLR